MRVEVDGYRFQICPNLRLFRADRGANQICRQLSLRKREFGLLDIGFQISCHRALRAGLMATVFDLEVKTKILDLVMRILSKQSCGAANVTDNGKLRFHAQGLEMTFERDRPIGGNAAHVDVHFLEDVSNLTDILVPSDLAVGEFQAGNIQIPKGEPLFCLRFGLLSSLSRLAQVVPVSNTGFILCQIQLEAVEGNS